MSRYRTAVLASALVLGGCSLATVRVPERVTADTTLDCSSSSPMADTVGAVFTVAISALSAVSLATDSAGGGGGQQNVGAALGAVVFAIPGLVYTISAIYGHRAIARCRRLERELVELVRLERADAEARVLEQASPLIEWATRSARYGDCARVHALAADAQALSLAVYRIFIRDAAIARCLSSPPPGPTPEPGSGPPSEGAPRPECDGALAGCDSGL